MVKHASVERGGTSSMPERQTPKGAPMRRVGRCQTRGRMEPIALLRRGRVTLGIALASALILPALASGATIHVDEHGESATFVNGGNTPKNYFDSIDKLSNDNGKCSLREAIEASNADAKVDGCSAGDGPGDVVNLPDGTYP